MKGKEVFLPSDENFEHSQIMLKNGFIIHKNGTVDTSAITLNPFYDAKRIAYLSAAMQIGKMLGTYHTLNHIKEQLSVLPIRALEDLSLDSPVMSEENALSYVKTKGFTQHYHHYGKSTNTHMANSLFLDSYLEANKFMMPEYRELTYRYAALTSCLGLNSWMAEKDYAVKGENPEFGTPYLRIGYGPSIIPYPDNPETHFRPRYSTVFIRVERFGISGGEIKAVTNFYEGSHMYIMPIFNIPKSLHKNVLYKVYDSEVHNLNKSVFRSNSPQEYNEYNFRTAFYHVSQRQMWNTSPPETLTQHYTTVATWDDIIADLNVPYEQWRDELGKTVPTSIATLWENYEQWIAHIRASENAQWNSPEDILAKGEILAEDERLKESLKIITRDHNKIVEKIDKAELYWNQSLSDVKKRI